MADALALFDARRSKWVNADGTLTREAQFFIRGLWERVGGPIVDEDDSDLGAVSGVANEALARASLSRQQDTSGATSVANDALARVALVVRQQPPQVDIAAIVAAAMSLLPRHTHPHKDPAEAQGVIATMVFTR